MSALNSLVSEAVDIVVHCARGPRGPRVTEIIAVEDLTAGVESTQFTMTELFGRRGYHQPLAWTGNVPVRSLTAFDDAHIDLLALLDQGAAGPREHR